MKTLMIFLSLIFILSSCSTSNEREKEESKPDEKMQGHEMLTNENTVPNDTPKLVDIVSDMADQLLASFPEKKMSSNILITTIVDIDNYKKTDKLGRLLSEQFIHQLHIRKFHIIDYKVPDVIQILPNGDFALTRDIKKLRTHIDADRLLVGTMSKTALGTQINVRIMNVKQDHVEATASAFIPNSLLEKKSIKSKGHQYLVRNSKATNEVVSIK